jgi:hypothetical protein
MEHGLRNNLVGVLYIVFGRRYQAEAKRSIDSLRKVCPKMRIAVITDSKWSDLAVPDIFILKSTEASYALKMRYAYDSPFDRTLCLDSDTIVARDVSALFGMLDYYDVGFHFGGPYIDEPNGLKFQMRAGTSVFMFKKAEHVADFFSKWSDEYYIQKQRLTAAGAVFDERGLDDTRSCAIAIAKSSVRSFQLGSFLYFDLGATLTTHSPPLIYHGRIPHMEMLDAEIGGNWNVETDWHPRLWMPNIRGILPAGVRRSDPILATALLLRRAYNSSKRRVRSLIHRKKRALQLYSRS